MKRTLFTVFAFVAAAAAHAAPTPAPSPSPAPVEMTQAEYNATVLHRDALIQQRDAALGDANKNLATQLAQLDKAATADAAAAGKVPDLQKQIASQDATITQLQFAKWKYAIISVLIALPLGAAAAIAMFLFTKASVTIAGVAAKLGIKTALA